MRVMCALELETASPVSNCRGGNVLSLVDCQLLLGAMLARCIRALHVPQGLVAFHASL